MSPTELFQEARLDEAVAAQTATVEEQPGDFAERLLLCDLLGFTGDRETVRSHLRLLEAAAPTELRPYLAEWFALLAADDRRHRGEPPTFLIDPPGHVARRVDALDRMRSGDAGAALGLIDAADEVAAWVEGTVDGREFDGWRDADDVLGPNLELFQADRYVWLPVDHVRKLRLETPDGLRDRLYRPVTVWLVNGSEWELFLPSLYTGTAAHAEEGIRSGAGIDWVDLGGLMRGAGSRAYLFGDEELELDEFRQVEVRRAYPH